MAVQVAFADLAALTERRAVDIAVADLAALADRNGVFIAFADMAVLVDPVSMTTRRRAAAFVN